MKSYLIKNGTIVNRGKQQHADILIKDGRIQKIAGALPEGDVDRVIDASGTFVLPGLIDDQVHFREPGLTHKANIYSESRAAVAGGVTSFMEMPNTSPVADSIEELEKKYDIAEKDSLANYSFYFGATNSNSEELFKIDPKSICGVKVFMGSSTGNMLVDNREALEKIFKNSPILIATHCEFTPDILENEVLWKEKFGEDIPAKEHPIIRSREACYKSTKMAIDLAKEHGANLHVLHLTTEEEIGLFSNIDLSEKKITGEACVHHLYFCDEDYEKLGFLIKCNPAVKEKRDRDAVRKAVRENFIDVIATDHAPHLWEEKQQSYFNAPSGVPLVQHSLQMLLELVKQGVFTIEEVVCKASHAVADRFAVEDRGYLDEGNWADIVIVDPKQTETVSKENIHYKCKWSPFEGEDFSASIKATFVSGNLAFENGKIIEGTPGKRLRFDR